KLLKSTDKYIGTPFEATMTVSSKDDVAKITKVFGTADVKVEPIDDTKVKISGDLGKMAKVALTDADSLFSNEDSKIAGKYGIKGQDAVNYWWTGFNTLEGKYKKEAEADLMNFVKSVNTKGLEVAYNFKGIEAENVADKAGVTAFMLVFYVFYTVFYGFAIMYLMEGLGIVASAHGEKAEA
ncbi:MAG: hypothetical protein M1489_00745, partial [Firmicutes bacterium]|nr:hypothetical protein [Bacillota bacterium]